jgi:hypothetical protein
MKYYIIYIILFIIAFEINAQVQPMQQVQQEQSKVQLASMFYNEQQWAKARDLYLELYNTSNTAH